jgi:hypothetical protein
MWRRPAESKANDTWRGIGDVSIVGVAVLFEMILSPARGHLETGMMHHLHPLVGMPDYQTDEVWLELGDLYEGTV